MSQEKTLINSNFLCTFLLEGRKEWIKGERRKKKVMMSCPDFEPEPPPLHVGANSISIFQYSGGLR